MNPQQFLNDLMRSSGLNAGPNITGSYTPEEILGGERVTTGQGTTEAGPSSPLNGDPRRQQNKNSRVTSGGGGRNSGGGSGRVTLGGGTASPGGAGSNLLMSRNNLLGGALALPTVGLVAADLAQGRTLDAAGTAVGGATTLAATEAIGRGVGGKYGAAIRGVGALAAPFVGNFVGNTLERVKAEKDGVAPAAASETEEVKAGRAKEKIDAERQLDIRMNELNAYQAAVKDMMGYASDQQFTNMQRQMPLIQKALDNQMVRQQALMNTQTSNYAMLGTVATAGKLATGAQAQAGETMRTMLSNNPYSGSVMQAPNISF